MRFSDLLKAPNISRPALEVRAGIDDLQRFSFTRSSSRPHFHCVTARPSQKVVHRRDRRGSARTPKELVGGLLGGESFPDQIAEPIAHIAGGVVRKMTTLRLW